MSQHDRAGSDCIVPECDGDHYCRGLCRTHYQRWKRTGKINRRGRLTHAEVASRAKAEAIVLLAGAQMLVRTASASEVARLLGLTDRDLQDAAKRLRGEGAGFDPPYSERRRKNRKAPKGQKWCPVCEQFKWLDQFNRNRLTADGRQGECGPCQRRRGREYAARKKQEKAS